MKVIVRFYPSKETKEIELEEGTTGLSLIENLNLNPDSYILTRSGKPIPIDEELTEGETLTLISVVSGG
jgi:sulfur carrier protein ThiS